MTFTFDLYMYKLLLSLWACRLKNKNKPIDCGSMEEEAGLIMSKINIYVKLDRESIDLMTLFTSGYQ